mgnify:CR=1 FL=1
MPPANPFFTFRRYSFTEISAVGGRAHVKSRQARLEDGKLTTETFEGDVDRTRVRSYGGGCAAPLPGPDSALAKVLLAVADFAEAAFRPRLTLMSLTITSNAFAPNGAIPPLYTCEGKDLSPPLAFGGVPAGTKSLALIVDDPDAPDPAAPKMTWVHWMLYNMPAATPGLPEAIKSSALPAGTREGQNDWGRTGYWRTVPADRPAPLFPQALRARCCPAHARAPGQARTG